MSSRLLILAVDDQKVVGPAPSQLLKVQEKDILKTRAALVKVEAVGRVNDLGSSLPFARLAERTGLRRQPPGYAHAPGHTPLAPLCP